MTKLIATLVITIIAILGLNAQFNFGKNSNLEIEFDNSYRIMVNYDNEKVHKSINEKLQTVLKNEGIIDEVNYDNDTFRTQSKTNGKKAYSFLITKNNVDLFINKELLEKKQFERLQKICKEIYHFVKKHKKNNKVLLKKEKHTKVNIKEKSKSNSFSYCMNIDIDDDDNGYSLTSKYNEKGQYKKLIKYLIKELGEKNLSVKGNTYEWKKMKDNEFIYFFSVSKGRFKVVLDKEFLKDKLYASLNEIANGGKLIIKEGNSNTPIPPKRY